MTATTKIARILCPIDFSEFSRRAIDLAVDLAGQHQAEIVALHVFVPPLAQYDIMPVPVPQFADVEPQLLKNLLGFLEPASAPGVRVRTSLRSGYPLHEILEAARATAADLIVMGTHGRTGFDRWLLGSTAESVLRKAPCPVLTVCRALEPPVPRMVAPFAKILCALDLSDTSAKTLRYATSLASEGRGSLTVLHTVEGLWDEALGTLGYLDVPEYRHSVETDARERLHRAIPDEMRATCQVEERVEAGRAYKQILRVASAQQPDLIVMGVHGASPIDVLFFGSTAQHVVRAATCPVLVVR